MMKQEKMNGEHGMGKKTRFLILILLLVTVFLHAQENDGFGFDDTDGFGFKSPSGFSVNIGGEVSAGFTGFFEYFDSADEIKSIRLGDIFLGSLDFAASTSFAEGLVKLNLRPVFDGSSPVALDEAFVRAFFGPVSVLGGLKKLSWGRADSFGTLDVINPLDYRDLTKLSDPQSVKIARPMIHADWSIASFSKLELVFVPWFEGHKFDASGRWMPNQMKSLLGMGIDIGSYYPDTGTLEYAQAASRFTTSIAFFDLGFQYYYGRLKRPSLVLRMTPAPLPLVDYSRIHQIGFDMAALIAGFNIRAEAGANITNDLDGTDGTVENPSIVWSLGFDRDLFWGINLNLQGAGSLRLFHDSIGASIAEDCEAETDLSSTRLTGIISKKFLRDELEIKLTGLWGIEDMDFLLMPSIIWSRNDLSAELSVGVFGGDREGELGQYRDNGFAKIVLSYKF